MEAAKENMSETVFHQFLIAVEQQRALCSLAQYDLPGRYLLTCSINNQSEAVISGQ